MSKTVKAKEAKESELKLDINYNYLPSISTHYHPFVNLSANLILCLSVNSFSIFLSTSLSTCLSTFLSINPSIDRSIYRSIYLYNLKYLQVSLTHSYRRVAIFRRLVIYLFFFLSLLDRIYPSFYHSIFPCSYYFNQS